MDKSVWKIFSKYHYLSAKHNNAAHVYVCYINDQISGFISVMPQPGKIKNRFRVHRLVVLPDYQGIGVGIRMLNDIAELYTNNNKKISIVTSAPSLLLSLNKNEKWRCSSYGRKLGFDTLLKSSLCLNRISASFQYKI